MEKTGENEMENLGCSFSRAILKKNGSFGRVT